MKRPLGKWLALLISCALVACADTDTRIPGERISVLSYALELTADPRLANADTALPPPFRNRQWHTPGGFANNALYHLELDGLQPAYQADIVSASGEDWRILAVPVVGDGRLFALGARADVGAIDAKSGAPLWRVSILPPDRSIPSFTSRALRFFPCLMIFPVRLFFDIRFCDRDAWFEPFEDGFGGGIAYADGRVFVATGFGELLALNAENGAVLWRVRGLVPFRSAPNVFGGRVFVVSHDSRLQVFSARDGTRQWDHQAIADPSTILAAASPAVSNQIVVAGFNSGELVAARVGNGTVNWSDSLASRASQITPLSELDSIIGRPVIDRDRVFATGHGGRMVSIDLRTGERVWTRDIGSIDTPWVSGNFVYVVTLEGQVVAVSRGQGRIRWVKQLENYRDMAARVGKILWHGPLLASGALTLVSSQGRIVRLDPKNGALIAEQDIDTEVGVAPIIADGTLYILDMHGDVHALR